MVRSTEFKCGWNHDYDPAVSMRLLVFVGLLIFTGGLVVGLMITGAQV